MLPLSEAHTTLIGHFHNSLSAWEKVKNMMASTYMANKKLGPLIKLTGFLILLSNGQTTTVATQSTTLAHQQFFEPTLTGFRCEGSKGITPDGVAVIEANSPIKVTLFGQSFTTETIIGFTAEFVHAPDAVDKVLSANEFGFASTNTVPTNGNESHQQHAGGLGQASKMGRSVDDSTTGRSNNVSSNLQPHPSATSMPQPRSAVSETHSHLLRGHQSEVEERAQKTRQRLLDRHHDCTDFDRVISYKLAEENIITPNVAVLTIRLPELDSSLLGSAALSGMYYHFCIKQPRMISHAMALELLEGKEMRDVRREIVSGGQLNGSSRAGTTVAEQPTSDTNLNGAATSQVTSSPLTYSAQSLVRSTLGVNGSARQLVWVHQGNEWWLSIKVEPPILSIANDCFLIVLLLILSAVASGLNLGLMSLDLNELAVISSCGDPQERAYARTIAPLRKRGNYLLCSLLLSNVMVNSTLTVVLEEMTSGLVAVIGSTLAIVVLGEIVPQAFCARQGLAIGARTIYLTYAFMIITFPLSYPIACFLDCILGEEKGNVYDRERLMEFIRITGNHTQLEADEVAIISGALKLKKIKVDQIMTKIEDVFMLPIDCMLDRVTIKSIIEKGYSRIPIYELNNRRQIVALILAKDLALLDPDDQMPLANMLMYCKHPLIFIDDTATLDVALNEFKTGKSHLAIVRQIYDDGEVDKYYEAIGVVTLEDVIEEVLQTEINDETDTLSDNRRKRRRADAQVAHLVDELLDSSNNSSPALAGGGAQKGSSAPGAPTTAILDTPTPQAQPQHQLAMNINMGLKGGKDSLP